MSMLTENPDDGRFAVDPITGIVYPPAEMRELCFEEYTADHWRIAARCATAIEWRSYCLAQVERAEAGIPFDRFDQSNVERIHAAIERAKS